MEIENMPTAIPAAERTISRLIHEYKTDPYSRYHKGRFATRQNTDSILRRIDRDHGFEMVAKVNARKVIGWHQEWLGPEGKKTSMAHALIGGLRNVTGHGVTMLEWEEARTLKMVLSGLRFPMSKPRTSILTTAQVIAIIDRAHERGLHSIAFQQALQHGLGVRQKDGLGEWVPITDPGVAIVTDGDWKWLRGVHWGEISSDLILTHTISKTGKPFVADLKLAPLIVRELKRLPEEQVRRGGPLIVSEATGLPYRSYDFRRLWRSIADECGIPKWVRNQDTRAGFVTEALSLGAGLQAVRKAATHSTTQMTEKYSRGDADAIAEVMTLRAARHNEMIGGA